MRSQCPDCGEMVPEGHSERCGDPADASLDESIPTLNMMRSARRVIKFWEERIALKGGINLVDDLKASVEAAIQQAEHEVQDQGGEREDV